jgi:hypothetical protein
MALYNFSPTVVAAYRQDADWHCPAGDEWGFDAAGYDSYGYNSRDCDRAGNNIEAYGTNTSLFQETLTAWGACSVTGAPTALVK